MTLPADHAERMERARLSLDGLAIGDAFGEMLAAGCAQARTRVERGLLAGPWIHTDDTEMALAIFETLHRHGRIEQNYLARRFAERFRRDPDRGYGQMARTILRAIVAGVGWEIAAAAAFDGAGSMGNGGAMRVAPLGAYFAEESDSVLRTEAALSAAVTHSHSEGKAGAIAIAVAAAAAWKLRGRPRDRASAEMMDAVYEQTPDGETRTGLARALKLPFSTPPEIAGRTLGNGSAVTAPDTVPFVVWSAARHLDDYREALIDTVLADGDCDTNCAMVGGIVALSAGLESIPEDWREAKEQFDLES